MILPQETIVNSTVITSPLGCDLSGKFLTKEDQGKFITLGITSEGQCHFYMLTCYTGMTVYLYVDLKSRSDIVSNCSVYKLVTELGAASGYVFVTEAAKTTVKTWFCLVNNSYYGLSTMKVCNGFSDLLLDDKVSGDMFTLVSDTGMNGYLALTSNKGDVCIISTVFDDPMFHNIDLVNT
jgi:hypothetical protein